MQTNVQSALAGIRGARSRDDAVRHFLGILDARAEHIADVKRRVEQVYRFETPDRPVFQYDVTGLDYQKSDWLDSDLDRLLDGSMQGLVFKLESMPESDFVPLLHTGIGKSDLIPPFAVQIAWEQLWTIYAVFGAMFVIAVVVLVVLLIRIKIFEAVKLGEVG